MPRGHAHFAAVALLLALAVCLPAAAAATSHRLGTWAPQWPWTPPAPGGQDLRGEWEKTLALLWSHSKNSVGFCVGRSQCVRRRRSPAVALAGEHLLAPLVSTGDAPMPPACPRYKAQRLMALSFPWPLPVGADPGDALCSNRSRIDARLCTPPEVEQYYKVGQSHGVIVAYVAACVAAVGGLVPPTQLAPFHPHAVYAADREPGKGAGQRTLRGRRGGPARLRPRLL